MANDFLLFGGIAGQEKGCSRQIIDHVMVYSTFSCMATGTSLNKWQINEHGSNEAVQDE
jgi:hypothetical protein